MFLVYAQTTASLAQFDVQHRINCNNCNRARDTNITKVITRSAVVVCKTLVQPPGPEAGWRLVIVPGMAAATPTKHIPVNEASAHKLAVFA
jgi:hypothetical protein